MIKSRKIKAFTLSEMIVVLILTSIVVGLAFSVLTLVQKHIYGIQTNFNHKTELNKLKTSLWIDFNRYSNIQFDNIENELKFSSDIDSVVYQFNGNYIAKKSDTFNIKIKNRWLFLNGNLIDKGDADAIHIETSKELQNQHLFVFKQNDAYTFMK